jgi:HAD superfamily hydrolase (TIGR01549 family)
VLAMRTPRAVVLDIDGTLVDTAYHHALAWRRAFAEHGVDLPTFILHRHVGMGGDRLVAAVAGDDVERRLGGAIRASWETRFDELLPEIKVLPGAVELLPRLRERGVRVVLATSAIGRHADAFLALLDARASGVDVVTADDVETSKPAPDLVHAAIERAGTSDAVMVGDTPWDGEAARRAEIPFLGVLSGGFAEPELRAGGALAVYDGVAEAGDAFVAGAVALAGG